MRTLGIIAVVVLTSALCSLGIYRYAPLSWFESAQKQNFGTSVTTINGSDTISSSRTTINNNFSALNTGKFELTDWYATTSKNNLITVGTVTTGTWNATTITGQYGGTSSTTLSLNQVMLGNTTSGLKTVVGYGTSGQVLVSNGVALAPTWQSISFDTAQNYSLTGVWNFNSASSTNFGVFLNLKIGSTATTTIQGLATASSTFSGSITATNIALTGLATTTTLIVSNGCTGCTGAISTTSASRAGPTSAATIGTVSAICAGNKVVVGGGGTDDSTTGNVFIRDSFPENSTTWTVKYSCWATGGCTANNMTAYAICATP